MLPAIHKAQHFQWSKVTVPRCYEFESNSSILSSRILVSLELGVLLHEHVEHAVVIYLDYDVHTRRNRSKST